MYTSTLNVATIPYINYIKAAFNLLNGTAIKDTRYSLPDI